MPHSMKSCVWLWYALVVQSKHHRDCATWAPALHYKCKECGRSFRTVTCTMEIEYLNLRNMNQVEYFLSKQSLPNKNNKSKNEILTNDCRTSTLLLLICLRHKFVWKKTWLQRVFSKPNFLSQNINFLCLPDNQKWASSMHRAATKLYLLLLNISRQH